METPPYQIWITTYELSDKGATPVLSHVFYGHSVDQAYGYAKSHLVTDFFFSSSFVGSMPWGNSVLHLNNDKHIVGLYQLTQAEINTTLQQLAEDAIKTNRNQIDAGIVVVIHEVGAK